MLRKRTDRRLTASTPALLAHITKCRVRWTCRAVAETLEERCLLSGNAYAFHQIGYFGANDTGANPQCTLVADTAGDLFGTTSAGGAYGGGTVFEIPAGGGAIITLASFNGADGASPIAGVTLDSTGNLYGTTETGGGAGNYGTVFEIAKGSATITTLASFNYTSGAPPLGGVMVDSAGNLYGTAYGGGTGGDGTVFEIVAGSNTITTLASFNGTNGANPYAGVTLDSAGNLYGTTSIGGASGCGTVFEIAKGSGSVTTLASFNGSNGKNPRGSVTLDSAGNVYGTTYSGGANGYGTVFEIAAGSSTITTMASFNYGDGANPRAGVTRDSIGDLYGTTYGGGTNGLGVGAGTVFEIVAGTSSITTLASFNLTDGEGPEGGVILDSVGNLYGTTWAGAGAGSVFEIAAGSNAITTRASFNTSKGEEYPQAGLTLDSAGNLYGTTYNAVFEIIAGSNTVTTLASFNGTNGANPYAGLTLDSAGNLYGTTNSGGANDRGTVFEIAKGSNTITTLASLNYSTGGPYPQGGVTLDSAGNLYGTTYGGGTYGDGTVFELALGSGIITTLASFDGTNGANPYAGVTLDSAGNLYGTTEYGGAGSDGTVFKLAKGGTITTLASFNGTNGANPYAGVTLDSAGNLYGTTYSGGSSSGGTVFEITAGSNAITTLASFDAAHGEGPRAGVTRDSAGNLYGTTSYDGGTDSSGTVWKIADGSSAVTTLALFNDTNGATPCGAVTLDPAGNLYGTTEYGGVSTLGAAFELVRAPIIDTINGSSGNDTVALTKDAGGVNIDWTAGSASGVLPVSDPNGLTINGTAPNTIINLDYSSGDPLPNTLHLNGTFTINGLRNLNATALDMGQSTVFS